MRFVRSCRVNGVCEFNEFFKQIQRVELDNSQTDFINMQKFFWNNFLNFWFAPIDRIRFDTFRVVSMICVVLYVQARWMYAPEWLTQVGFHIAPGNLPYHTFAVSLLPMRFLFLFGAVFFAAMAAVIVGWQLRLMLWIVWGCFLYVTLADQVSAFVINKLSIVSLLILALVPNGYYWTIGKRNVNDQYQSAWPVRILQLTIIICYFSAGWSKAVYGEWLKSGYVLWSQIQGTYLTDFGAWMVRVFPLWSWPIMQCSALVFELMAPLSFGIKSFRKVAFWWGLGFQLLVAFTMHQLIYFSLVILSFYVVFMDEKFLRGVHEFFALGWRNVFGLKGR